MNPRLFLATMLLLQCPALAGCGNSPAMPNAEAKIEPLSAADIADAEAEMNRASEEERAYQSENPVGKQTGRNLRQ